jgi:hypothetical protein
LGFKEHLGYQIGFKRGFIDSPKKLKSSGVKRLIEDALWIHKTLEKIWSKAREDMNFRLIMVSVSGSKLVARSQV